ncbi:MAG TPA: anhydro-N-acetylmuramic acid kinase [Alphaproteobacteria bacterium]|nr:anhydro-N-acetylmuramic acid kinase [Alphaproteobacteria bacterium]
MKSFLAIGLMSGTSMDGVDAAIIKTDGRKIIEFGNYLTIPYQKEFRQQLKELVFNRGLVDKIFLEDVERELTIKHAEAVDSVLKKAPYSRTEVDVVGFHGHTVDHRPFDKFTWQIGDGRLLAELTRINVVNDFRSNDVKNGGQGAPLMPIYHKAIVEDKYYPTCILNIGGVANITYIGEKNLIAFDTGTGNALIDDILNERVGINFDEGGKIAGSGEVIKELLDELISDDYFRKPPPKSLDRNHFRLIFKNWLSKQGQEIKTENIVSTLAEFSVLGVIKSMDYLPKTPKNIFVCGGGVHNKYIMERIQKLSNIETRSIAKMRENLNPNAIEAQGFAFMAVRNILALPISFKNTTGIEKKIICGKMFRA